MVQRSGEAPDVRRRSRKKEAKGRAPVEIVRGIVTVSEHGRDRDDALVRVVGEGHVNVDDARFGLGGSVTGE